MRDWIKMRHDAKMRKKIKQQYKDHSEDSDNDILEEDGEETNLQDFLSDNDKLGPAVRDHSHWDGQFRGACK